MTREEKQKAIYVLKKSAPVMPLTQEEFNGYIQAINQVIDWLEQEPCGDCVSRNFMHELGATCIAKRNENGKLIALGAIDELPSVTPQESKIKVLDRDEVIRKLGAVDVYQARAWITLLNDLEFLKLKICEVEE